MSDDQREENFYAEIGCNMDAWDEVWSSGI